MLARKAEGEAVGRQAVAGRVRGVAARCLPSRHHTAAPAISWGRALPQRNSASRVGGSRGQLGRVAIDGQILVMVERSRCHARQERDR